ncbi:MAG: hypothetical protein QNK04_30015 [Myxococcota bacterium]|nr:hypothetical protein [Myxococcota bacterium]
MGIATAFRAAWLPAIGTVLLAALLAPPAGAEVRSVEAVGAVPLDPNDPPRRPPRDLAVQRALAEAVQRVALDELPEFDPVEGEVRLWAALGKDPLDYAQRFRILEDRGERPALFTEIPGVSTEYVVLVEVQVDAELVRRRLRDRGLLTPTEWGARRPVRVVLEDVGTWASYRAVRTLLEEVGARTALPVEMEQGRAVLDVEGDRTPDELVAALMRAAPPNLRLVPLGVDDETVRLRARFLDTPAAQNPERSSRASRN